MVGPLTVSLASWFGSGHTHALAVTCIMIVMLAAALEPKVRLSYHRDRVTFWLQGLNVSQ